MLHHECEDQLKGNHAPWSVLWANCSCHTKWWGEEQILVLVVPPTHCHKSQSHQQCLFRQLLVQFFQGKLDNFFLSSKAEAAWAWLDDGRALLLGGAPFQDLLSAFWVITLQFWNCTQLFAFHVQPMHHIFNQTGMYLRLSPSSICNLCHGKSLL